MGQLPTALTVNMKQYGEPELFHYSRAFYFKRKILLRNKAERYYNKRGEYFGNGWINMALFYEQLNEDIVEENADRYQQKIAE